MRPRDLGMLCGAVSLAAVAGFAWLGQESYAVELAPPGPAAPAVAAMPMAEPPAEAPAGAADAVAPATAAAPVDASLAAPRSARPSTAGWTTGIVRGDIQLAVSVLERLQSLTVVVEEARNAIAADGSVRLPTRFVVPVPVGRGTPTFEVRDIPFSDYPYVVSVHAPGLNGSRRTISIDQGHALVDDVVLAVTPGAPYSVLVRDQDGQPFVGIDLRLMPVGEPAGRPMQQGTTDSFGSIVFEAVLAGDYQVFASLSGQMLLDPPTLHVQPGVRVVHGKVQGQGHTLTIPRGVPVQFLVHDVAGYGIPGAKVTATATDRTRLTVREATTDAAGRADFAHLQPGTWQVTFEFERFERRDVALHLQAGQEPVYKEVRLVRAR